MGKMILCGAAASDRMHTMRLICEEKKADYLVQAAAVRVHSPSLQHGHVSLYDIRAIARYVDSVFGGIRLYPEGAGRVDTVERWINWADCCLRPALDDQTRRRRLDLDWICHSVARKGFLCGPAPTLADFYLFPVLDRFVRDAPVPERLKAYHDRMSMRDSVWTLPHRMERKLQ